MAVVSIGSKCRLSLQIMPLGTAFQNIPLSFSADLFVDFWWLSFFNVLHYSHFYRECPGDSIVFLCSFSPFLGSCFWFCVLFARDAKFDVFCPLSLHPRNVH